MRRVRLNNNKQHRTLDQISVLRYSTLVIPIIDNEGRPNLAPGLVLRIDKGNNQPAYIFFDPVDQLQPVLLNQWQEWDAFEGDWQIFGDPGAGRFRLADFIQQHPLASLRNDGQGAIRFTIGGENLDYHRSFHYVDRFTINKVTQPDVSALQPEIVIYDFDCKHPLVGGSGGVIHQ